MAASTEGRSFFGQPVGVGVIVFTEGWERFSFYGMQALLVLYMTGHLLLPGTVETVAGFAVLRHGLEAVFGPLSLQALASQIFGLYVGLVYFFPVLGGLAGDRWIGRTPAVIAGGALMAAGHFMLAFEQSFLYALVALILGSGLLKGNLAAQVGALYGPSDSRRDSAYSFYCLAINTGAFIAPLVCGTLGELHGWHYGFAAAGVGMLVALCVYVAGRRHLPADVPAAARAAKAHLQPGDARIIAALAALIAITSLYWAGQTQVWNTYPIWLRDHVDRHIGSAIIPVTWFQSLDTFATVCLAPVVIAYWRWQARHASEPGDLRKIYLGCIVFASGCGLLSIGEWLRPGAVNVWWCVLFHFVSAIGYLYIWPITLALISRRAPAPVNGMMVGSYYLAIFAGGLLSGWLGRFYESLSTASFWILHGTIVGCGAILIRLIDRGIVDE